MINKSIRKFIAGTVVATYLFTTAAPMATAVSMYKPELREDVTAQGDASLDKMKLAGEVSITDSDAKINLSLRDSDVKQVLRMFADKAGLNIVFHDSVKGKVTMDLVDVPVNDAFKLVMQIANLTYFVESKTMIVSSAEASKTLNMAKQDMLVLPVKYIDASLMANFLNKTVFNMNKPGLSNADVASFDPASNQVLIFGTENDAKIAKKFIDRFDKKPTTETFVVNHTTPREMANLVCNMLLPATYQSTSGGRATGGAAATSNSSSTISIGEGIVACSATPSASETSLPIQSLSVSYFPQRGVVSVLGGSAEQVEMIREFVAANDKKQPQAYLEISILELNETGMRDFQNVWNVNSSFLTAVLDPSNGTSTYGYGPESKTKCPMFITGHPYETVDATTGSVLSQALRWTGPFTLDWAFSYLIKNTKARTLANPKILVTNGQTSLIDMTEDYIESTKKEYNSNNLQAIAQTTYEIGEDQGIKVELVPFISPDGYVTLNIKPDYVTSKDKIGEVDGPNGMVTLMNRRNLDLKNVRIKDGETLIIGGMIREYESKIVGKIPFLGDIPGIGAAFRSTSTEKKKEELVIMITPKIIKDVEDLTTL